MEEADKLLKFPPSEIEYKNIFLVCKLLYSQGMTTKELKKKIFEYARKIPSYNDILHKDMIEKIIIRSKAYSLKRSDINIAITRNEIQKIKKFPHKIYKIALYILFLSKLEKFQDYNKNDTSKPKKFKTYLNYSIKTVCYNIGINLTDKEFFEMCHELTRLGIIYPTLNTTESWVVLIADYDDKNIEFIIDANKQFSDQVKYYCINCGNQCEKSKRHDLCKDCYKIDLRNRKNISDRKNRGKRGNIQ